MTAPDSRRRYGAEAIAQRWLAKSEARRRVHGAGNASRPVEYPPGSAESLVRCKQT
jgi:hypothetical protein